MHGLGRWDDMRVFLAVLREGSFTAAARTLAIEQSTVSRRIAALEAELGASLFDRLSDGLRATELAGRLRAHAEQAEAQVIAFGDLARGASHEIEGVVRLALTESFAVHVLIPHVLRELERRYPRLAVELVASDYAADLGRREADIAVRFFRSRGGDLVEKRVAKLPLAVLGQRDYVRGRGSDPADYDWVSMRLAGITTHEQQFLAKHVGRPPKLVVSSHLLQVEAVRAGLGVALLTRALCRLQRELVELDLGLPAGPTLELWLVTPRALRNVPRVAAVWSLLEELLRPLGRDK